MFTIKHQTQPSSNTCVSTCLAMILGVPVQDVISEFHCDYYHRKTINVSDYLHSKGLRFITCGPEDEIVSLGKVYIATVPSLQTKGGFHQIVIDATTHHVVIYDPLQGMPGKAYYVTQGYEGDDPLAFKMISFLLDYEVSIL